MEKIRDPDRARRMARVLFSDIVVYAGDQVRIGLEKDDIFDRLHGEIERARVFYGQQVDPELEDAERIFDFALVDVLIAGNRKVSTHIW
ncbi:MAG: hypothetical protein ACE5FG_06990 [Myxococcota bacterium]